MIETYHYIDSKGKHLSTVFFDEWMFSCLEIELYALGLVQPDFNLPAVRSFFEVIPQWDTYSGNYELVGFYEKRHGYWECFLCTDEKCSQSPKP